MPENVEEVRDEDEGRESKVRSNIIFKSRLEDASVKSSMLVEFSGIKDEDTVKNSRMRSNIEHSKISEIPF